MIDKLYYGAGSYTHIVESATKAVSVFGGGDEHVRLLLGTACTETDFATFDDIHPDKWGVGIVQFDKIRFDDVVSRTRKRNRVKFFENYGVRLGNLHLHDLARNIDLSFAVCRLAYILIPEVIPKSLPLQAEYWKKYWNTYHPNAKGSAKSYLEDWASFMPIWI